jgi:hypothetical protein
MASIAPHDTNDAQHPEQPGEPGERHDDRQSYHQDSSYDLDDHHDRSPPSAVGILPITHRSSILSCYELYWKRDPKWGRTDSDRERKLEVRHENQTDRTCVSS